jgi:hypothetical protein
MILFQFHEIELIQNNLIYSALNVAQSTVCKVRFTPYNTASFYVNDAKWQNSRF